MSEAVSPAKEDTPPPPPSSSASPSSPSIHSSPPSSTAPSGGANIASSIMLRVPTHRLGHLRREFESRGGLDLAQFLKIFVCNMDLPNDAALLRIVPDLVDFFNQVDVNGDGTMEWSEFVMFVIEQVVQESNFNVEERMENVARMMIQPLNSRQPVRSSKVFPGISRVFVGVDEKIKIYEPLDKSPEWFDLNVAIQLQPLSPPLDQAEMLVRTTAADEIPITILDMCFYSSKDILIVLRGDLGIEFLRFSTRAKFSAETVMSLGVQKMDHPVGRIAIRDLPKETVKLFMVGASNIIYVQNIEVNSLGQVTLTNDKPLVKHTDYVRDVMVINTDSYRLLVSCGMDGKVFIWDLYTLAYKSARTGHTAGVECLAYDGKSVLLAGGFDYSIVGWDLDAEIDKPIFHLIGHGGTVMKVVGLGQFDRCVSLDNLGEIRYWDTSKTNPNDGTDRQIHTIHDFGDKARSLEVVCVSGGKFETANGIIIAAQGRKQHVYKVTDLSPNPSAPVTALVSENLLMFISIHVKEIIFWDLVTGYFQNSLKGVCSAASEILCAILDDRKRKLIIGDSLGVVTVYNCLSGVVLKTFPSLPYAVRFMIYSPDKNIIVLAGVGDLFVLDEAKEECDIRCLLRETKGHDSDVVAMCYSHDLGLIATADCTGALYIWSYEYMTLEGIIPDCCGTEIGQIAFLDPFPLLLVTDKANNFTIVLTKPMSMETGPGPRRLWRVETVLPTVEVKVRNTVSMFHGLNDEGVVIAEEGSEISPQPSQSGLSSAASNGETDDEDGDEENLAKPLNRKHMNRYLLQSREAKSLVVTVEGLVDKKSEDMNDADLVERIRLMTKIIEPEDDIYKTIKNEEAELEMEGNQGGATRKPLTFSDVSDSFKVLVQIGYDDGFTALVDLTPAILEIGYPPVKDHEKVHSNSRYDPHRTCQKAPRANEMKTATWTEKDTSGASEGFTTCHLKKVWKGHNGVVTSLNPVGDPDDHQFITTSEDYAIKLWDVSTGHQKAVLTRGRDLDKLIKARWKSPIDMSRREAKRFREAGIFVSELALKRVFIPTPEGGLVFGRAPKGDPDADESDKLMNIGKALLQTTAISTAHGTLSKPPSENSLTLTHKSSKSQLVNTNGSENLRETKYAIDESEPGRSRVIGQLNGRLTYQLSNKEITKLELAEKKEIEKQKKERLEKRARKQKNADGDVPVQKSEEALYLDFLMSGGDESVKKKSAAKTRLDEFVNPTRERKIKSKYDLEIEYLDASDPMNWEIQSVNRQRLLYHNMYAQMDKAGLTQDLVAMIQERLNELSPNGDFVAFVETIRKQRKRAREEIKAMPTKKLSEEVPIPVSDDLKLDLTEVLNAQSGNMTKKSLTVKPKPFVCSKVLLSDTEENAPPEPLNIRASDALPLMEKAMMSPVHPFKTSAPVELAVHQIITSKSLPDIKVFNTKREYNEIKNMVANTSYSSLLPVPRNLRIINDNSVVEERIARQEAVEKFDQSIRETEKLYRKSNRQRRKDRKSIKKIIRDNTDEIGTEDFKKNLESMMPRHRAVKLTFDKLESLDEMIEVGRIQETIEKTLKKKLEFTESSFNQIENKEQRQAKKAKQSKAKQNQPETSGLSAEEIQKQNDHRILTSHEFGPYKLSELLKLKTLFDNFPKKIIIVKNTDNSYEDTRKLLKLEEEQAAAEAAEAAASSAAQQNDEDDDDDRNWDEDGEKADSPVPSRPKTGESRPKSEETKKKPAIDWSQEKEVETVNLSKFLDTSYFRLRPQYRRDLNTYLEKRTDGINVLRHHVHCSFEEIVRHMCPFMSASVRKDFARYIELTKPPEEVEKEEEDGISMDNLQRLRMLFNFFDIDKSGGVDVSEILTGLKKAAASNKKPGTSSLEIDENAIRTMIMSVDNDENCELSFEEFVQLFKNVL